MQLSKLNQHPVFVNALPPAVYADPDVFEISF